MTWGWFPRSNILSWGVSNSLRDMERYCILGKGIQITWKIKATSEIYYRFCMLARILSDLFKIYTYKFVTLLCYICRSIFYYYYSYIHKIGYSCLVDIFKGLQTEDIVSCPILILMNLSSNWSIHVFTDALLLCILIVNILTEHIYHHFNWICFSVLALINKL